MRDITCSCGARYCDHRTGLSFSEVRRMMWVSDDDPGSWRNKRRRGVLGFWHELKWHDWQVTHGACEV